MDRQMGVHKTMLVGTEINGGAEVQLREEVSSMHAVTVPQLSHSNTLVLSGPCHSLFFKNTLRPYLE